MSAQPKVTISRVESWLRQNEIFYEIADETTIHAGFENCVMVFSDQHSDFLTVSSAWRGEFDPSTEPTLAVYVDEHNYAKLGPRASYTICEDGILRLEADMCLFTSEGMSNKQLHSGLGLSIVTILNVWDIVSKDFPALVTWAEED